MGERGGEKGCEGIRAVQAVISSFNQEETSRDQSSAANPAEVDTYTVSCTMKPRNARVLATRPAQLSAASCVLSHQAKFRPYNAGQVDSEVKLACSD